MNKKTSIADIQIFKNSVGQAEAGENVGINVKDAPVHTLKRGMMLAKVNSFEPTNHFEGTAYFLTKVIFLFSNKTSNFDSVIEFLRQDHL